ncbi:TetR/AcrR family transcriptional regulator [Bradyrhizobium sp. Ai1a-2]|uniref:TetR/AcrR family transcriptional regulator n=1 Tax=Bradyrhizobium sp. Ai1a-2 TaxID=196490 RepID=UPI001FCB5C38|nr:TetR/AcrR family transcriptional regulator [Bradyrhizobium sp. Ai1a-2]
MKELIIDAAVGTLHRKGFNATSVQDITDAAKVPKGSFYNHFESKEALAVEALERYWRVVLSHLQELNDESRPPLDRLKSYFERLSGVGRDCDYERGCMIGNMGAEMPDQSRLVRERLAVILAAWSRAIETCVKEAQLNGSLRRDLEPKAIAAFLLNSWEGAVMRSKVDRDDGAFRAFFQVVFTSISS